MCALPLYVAVWTKWSFLNGLFYYGPEILYTIWFREKYDWTQTQNAVKSPNWRHSMFYLQDTRQNCWKVIFSLKFLIRKWKIWRVFFCRIEIRVREPTSLYPLSGQCPKFLTYIWRLPYQVNFRLFPQLFQFFRCLLSTNQGRFHHHI